MTGEDATCDLALSWSQGRDGDVDLMIAAPADRFESTTLARILANLATLLEAMVACADQPVTLLPIIADAERQQLLVGFNDTAADYPGGCVHELIEAQVRRTPEAVAAVFGDTSLSYAELDRRANRLAHRLLALGIEPDDLVAVCVERSLDMLVAVLGVMKSGGAYVPLDPAYPDERVRYMLDDASAKVLVTQTHLLGDVAGASLRRIDLDSDWDVELNAAADGKPATGVGADHLAYVIYTSGSTGRPKGVEVPHRGVVNFLVSMAREPGCDAADVVLAVTTLSFDIAVLELYLPLSVGGRVVIATRSEAHDGRRLSQLLQAHEVSFLQATPATWRLLIEAGWQGRATLTALCGGEAMPPELARELVARVGQLWNMYGPTETTVWSTVCHIDGATPISIGHPIANTQIRMLDANRQLVPIGVPGELCIGGDGVVRGYHLRPDLTADRFITDPFAELNDRSVAGAGRAEPRLYRTGDLARYLDDGTIEFLGRLDNQVKVRGFRIELGEIEAVLADADGVARCVVVARPDDRGGHFLAAYYTAESPDGPPIDQLRSTLARRLPDYMVPAAYVRLDALPLTPNGKIDRKALPEPGVEAYATSTAYREATTPLEQFLVKQWQAELGLPRVGVDDNFFELGGDSIRGASLINRVQQRLGEFLYVVALFDHPTVADFADYLCEAYADAVSQCFDVSESRTQFASADDAPVDERAIAQLRAVIPARTPPVSSDTAQSNPPAVFILSSPRSGTTLLRVMLAGHPRLFAPPELELLGFATLAERSASLAGRYALWAEGTLRALMELEGCDADEARRVMDDAERRGLTTGQFYGELQARLGERILVDKSTTYALDVETLRAAEQIFAGARYIHLTRHPAGMIRSFEKVHLDQVFFRYEHNFSPRRLAELIWNVCHENILSFLADVPAERKCRLQYEEVVREPEVAMREVCAVVGIDYDPAMIEPYRDKEAKMTDGLHDVSTMLGDMKFHQHGRIDPRLAETWKQAALLESLGEPTRRTALWLGYELPTAQSVGVPADDSASHSPVPTDLKCVVGIQPGGAQTPVFFVTGGGGGVFIFEPLARRLGAERPVFGIQLPGVAGRDEPIDSIPKVASHLLAEVRRVQPHGPYVLGGLCAGGSIAFEMAQQMRHAGETVALLVLMDTWRPSRRARCRGRRCDGPCCAPVFTSRPSGSATPDNSSTTFVAFGRNSASAGIAYGAGVTARRARHRSPPGRIASNTPTKLPRRRTIPNPTPARSCTSSRARRRSCRRAMPGRAGRNSPSNRSKCTSCPAATSASSAKTTWQKWPTFCSATLPSTPTVPQG
ncbi:MAG: amino acid adenylation domain-containing protein [Pirellulales bacterium]